MPAISVFDIFKIGVGPSSSHTMGPWRAAEAFLNRCAETTSLNAIESIKVDLYGSLAKTGRGHGTDLAVIMGLLGEDLTSCDTAAIPGLVDMVRRDRALNRRDGNRLPFDPAEDIRFNHAESLTFHPNGIRFSADTRGGQVIEETYFSIGGGFIIQETDSGRGADPLALPMPIDQPDDLLRHCHERTLSIPEVVLQNELAWRTEDEIVCGLSEIFSAMRDCAYRGSHSEGTLPGGLNVVRRAAQVNRTLLGSACCQTAEEWLDAIRKGSWGFHETLKWVSCFALAVNEENAAFGRVVTAPTNGAAGVIPAVLLYYICFCNGGDRGVQDFLLTAGELGSIFKKGATISAAVGGCQAEIGVSSAMAAAALAQCLGASPAQALMAAEIAMEHHLGLTCDPVGGLVQIPCIERNTMGAVKAITAANIALESDPAQAKVSLADVITSMWETAKDMNAKYKETAEGGLALQIPVNVIEC